MPLIEEIPDAGDSSSVDNKVTQQNCSRKIEICDVTEIKTTAKDIMETESSIHISDNNTALEDSNGNPEGKHHQDS